MLRWRNCATQSSSDLSIFLVRLMTKNKKRRTKTIWIIALLLIVGLLAFSINSGLLFPLRIGYLTGTQGLQPEFNSIFWHNAYWSPTEIGTPIYGSVQPSSLSFGYSMSFDPDEATKGMPNFCASQQPITIQTDTEPKQYTWNYKVGSKTLANGTIVDEYKEFTMLRYKADWAINIWLSGSAEESIGRYGGWPFYPYVDPNYAGSELWIKLVPRSFCYFKDNPDSVFFAPAYIGLTETAHWVGINKEGQTIDPDPQIVASQDLIPKAQGETVGIYYQRGGGEIISENVLLSYQGTTLDPEIFRSEYWMRVNMIEFKPLSWYDYGIWFNYKFPSCYLKFTVYLFVVGTWTVYIKTGEVPELQPHIPIMQTGNPISDFFNTITSWLSNPFNMFLTGLIMIVVVIVLLAVFAPGVLALISGISRRGAKTVRRKKKS